MSEDLTDKMPNSEDKLERIVVGIESLDKRLANLEVTVDQRLRATQPIWEGMQKDLSTVQIDLSVVQKDLSTVQIDLSLVQKDLSAVQKDLAGLRAETEKGFRTVDRRMERQIGEFERLHAYQRDLEDRVDRLEKLSSS